MAHTFASLGKSIFLYEERDGNMEKYQQVLWGDWLQIDDDRVSTDEFTPIVWAKDDPDKRRELWVRKDETTDERPLEIIFVDVGQGDGCVLITPERGHDERIMVIDAGEDNNMIRFLDGRFKAYKNGFDFHAAVITHPDKDHYNGFREIFENHKIGFDHVYHNGLMELPVSGKFEKVGGISEDEAQGVKYVNRLWETNSDVEADFSDDSQFGRFDFSPVVHAAITNPNIGPIEMLSTEHGVQSNAKTFVPGFSPDDQIGYDIEVLGPVVELNSVGERRLRKISSYGKTKNGHSILLRLTIGDFRIFFGGDLNKPAEKFLIEHYTKADKIPKTGSDEYKKLVIKARARLQSDVMKTCHHGAADVTDIFLDSVNPACFVISSGDQEGHVHPRPDLLGRLGRFGRGESPVLLSTELQRSTRAIESEEEVARVLTMVDDLHDTPSDLKRAVLKDKIEMLARNNVDVYGAIYVKTDGNRLITAFKKETQSKKNKWFYFEYELQADGALSVAS